MTHMVVLYIDVSFHTKILEVKNNETRKKTVGPVPDHAYGRNTSDYCAGENA